MGPSDFLDYIMESVWEYRALLLSGTLVTVQLAIGSLLLSVLLGLAGASAKLARNPVSQRLANAYTTLVRGVPDLVLMMLLFGPLAVLLFYGTVRQHLLWPERYESIDGVAEADR